MPARWKRPSTGLAAAVVGVYSRVVVGCTWDRLPPAPCGKLPARAVTRLPGVSGGRTSQALDHAVDTAGTREDCSVGPRILCSGLKTTPAQRPKERLRDILVAGRRVVSADRPLTASIHWERRCRPAPLTRLGATCRNHLEVIPNHPDTHLDNSLADAISGRTHAAKTQPRRAISPAANSPTCTRISGYARRPRCRPPFPDRPGGGSAAYPIGLAAGACAVRAAMDMSAFSVPTFGARLASRRTRSCASAISPGFNEPMAESLSEPKPTDPPAHRETG